MHQRAAVRTGVLRLATLRRPRVMDSAKRIAMRQPMRRTAEGPVRNGLVQQRTDFGLSVADCHREQAIEIGGERIERCQRF